MERQALKIYATSLRDGWRKSGISMALAQKLRFAHQLEQLNHPPRPMCGSCHSLKWEWAPTRGTGTVCWTTVHQALDPAFAQAVPYAAVVVELDEGPRLATWVTGIPPDQLRVGLPVEVWFDAVSDEVTLPKFKPQVTSE